MLKYMFAFITYVLIYIGEEKESVKYFLLACASMLIAAAFLMIETVKGSD